MKSQRIIMAIGVIITIATINDCMNAGQTNRGPGKLTGGARDPKVVQAENTLPLDKDVYLSTLKRPNCDPKGLGIRPIDELVSPLDVKNPSELGIIFSPAEKPVLLHKLALQIYSGGKVVFRTQVECGGCNKTYQPVESKDKNIIGYLFVLDDRAAKAASRFFVAGNKVELIGNGHKGGPASFYFTRAKGSAK
jgi:hypothetical protein